MNTLKAPSLPSLLDSEHGSNDSMLAESLQLDIEELDDEEYAIPAVDTIPTLESVLSEIDSDLDSVSALGIHQSNGNGSGTHTSLADDCSATTPSPSLDDHLRLESILRHVVLQGVTAQLTSAVDRVDAGLATSCAVSMMIAVGTSHGHILAFDCTQTLKWCCQEGVLQGAVAAMAFNEDNSRLLAGFARGGILMIDTQTGDVIRTLTDVITPNTGVLHLKWTNKPALALCADSGGSVWSLNFTRRLGIRGCDARCLFSGARGEVCTVEPLLFGEEEHPLKTYTLVALATLSKFFVVLIRPRLKVIKFHPMVSYPDCLPLLAWQMVLIQAADSRRTIDPVLAAARGSDLFFYQLTNNSGRISLLFLRHIQLSYNLLAVHWLGPKTIACLDTKEILHLSDVRTSRQLEQIDLSNVGLMYNSAQFKGLATGGNVSPALALAGAAACYSTVVSQGNRLYFLGGKSLHAISARAWSDRISYLASMQRWDEAIDLAIEGYRAAGGRHRRLASAKERILRMYEEYLSATKKQPELCLEQIIACLIEINEKQLLWEDLYDRLPSPDHYLLIIANHIEREHLDYIAPSVAQVLCDYFWKKGDTVRLEELILKLNWQCLDLHQVLTICRKEKLYRAQMYLNAKALGDYTISLTDLIPQIEPAGGNLHLGNCILVYISSCLAGRGYPTGDIAPETIPTVKHEVLRCLTVIHSKNAPEDELPYPYLRKLLEFDTRETLNVISLAFQEREFNGELGLSQRQRIINILVNVVTPDRATWSQVGALLNFIAQQIASRELPESDLLLDKVVAYLTMPPDVPLTRREHFEREQTWLELLRSNCLEHIPTEQLLEIARQNKCYHVAEYLLERLERFEDIFECYLLDEYRHLQLFSYVSHHATDPKRQIYPLVVKHLCQLVDINCEQAARVLVDNFMKFLSNFLKILDHAAVPERLFNFLGALIRLSVQLETTDLERYLELLCQYRPEEVTEFLKSNDSYRLDNAVRTIKRFELSAPLIFLYEKQGDYQSAYAVAVKNLEEAPESSAEMCALLVTALCIRASAILTESDREQLWFSLLNIVLARNDLTAITKNVLHSASEFLDLSKLVQLVLNSGTKTGNFGDIKHLLIGMLSNSAYESLLIQTTSRILGEDLHSILARERKLAMRGLAVKSIKCIVCRVRLCNADKEPIIVMGDCGHAMHRQCAFSFCTLPLDKGAPDAQSQTSETSSVRKLKCPRCDAVIIESGSVKMPECYVERSNALTRDDQSSESNSSTLKLSAPPRVS
ncbi:vacuolar protein sorting-associated protein 8 homolog [Anopheles ziemanni]|uniref:vacuolar protein sorting-associated protein 8 homolog n=1 Tax=Anopheles coustani TaxID=139045 RepID=UPI00265827E1|nr:vacuolar protein sorting-associated protein 8 homolog [Anopheles coustani]XP_058176498.1 vacuolar protein sorting-associated protein 8 homolog [Anopheles ziemanni]